MMTQPAATTGAASTAAAAAGAGTGADAAGSPASGSADGSVFSQALQALAASAAGAAGAVPAVQADDPTAAQIGGTASPANPVASDGALLEAVKLPNAAIRSPNGALTNAKGPASTVVQSLAESNSQSPDVRENVSAVAQGLLRTLFAKPSLLSTTDGAAPRATAKEGEGEDTSAANDDDAAPGIASATPDSSAAVATLLTQLPVQAPAAVALKWQEPSGARTTQASVTAPLGATNSIAATPAASSLPDLHPVVTSTLTRSDDASSIAAPMSTPGATADAPRTPRLVAVADASIDTSGMAAALRTASAANSEPVEHAVAVPVHDRHWPTAMAAQVLILSGDKVRAATLRLTPEHLGPVEVRIDMQDSSVNVNFTAAHAETRTALEQAMPQLRSVLAGAGLTLGQATVQQQARHGSQNPQPMLRGAAGADEVNEAPVNAWRALGLVDEYA